MNTRRGLLRRAVLGGAGIVAARAATRGALAGGGAFQLGQANSATATTSLNVDFESAALRVTNAEFPGPAIAAYQGPPGSRHSGDEGCVTAYNNALPAQQSLPVGVVGGARGAGIGVRGFSENGKGVYGESLRTRGKGAGVVGIGPTGVKALAGRPGGVGLEVLGRAVFSQAGIVFIPEGQSEKEVAHLEVRPRALILATLQGGYAGIQVGAAARVNGGTIRIQLSGPAPSGGVRVGYLVVN